MDGKSDVTACGIEGGTSPCQSCSENEHCASGACVRRECAPTVCYYQNQSCLNGDMHCGRDCLDCTSGAVEGTCDKETGKCTVIGCKEGYHLSAEKERCQPDTVNACGSHNNDCEKQDGWKEGECIETKCHVTDCLSGHHLLSLEDSGVVIEFDRCVEDTLLFCGPEAKSCENPLWDLSSCENGKCVPLKCYYLLCLKEDACVDGTTTAACGNELACQQCLDNEICYSGECIARECHEEKDCTLFRGMNEVWCEAGKCSWSCRTTDGYGWFGAICAANCEREEDAHCGANEVCIDGNQCECVPGEGKCGESQKCCISKVSDTDYQYQCRSSSGGGYICP